MLNYFSRGDKHDFVEEKVIVCYPDAEGFLIFCILDPEQWLMVCDIASVSQKSIEEITKGLVEEGLVAAVAVDPTEDF